MAYGSILPENFLKPEEADFFNDRKICNYFFTLMPINTTFA